MKGRVQPSYSDGFSWYIWYFLAQKGDLYQRKYRTPGELITISITYFSSQKNVCKEIPSQERVTYFSSQPAAGTLESNDFSHDSQVSGICFFRFLEVSFLPQNLRPINGLFQAIPVPVASRHIRTVTPPKMKNSWNLKENDGFLLKMMFSTSRGL